MARSRSFLYMTMLLIVATLGFSAKAQTPHQQSLFSSRTPARLTNTDPATLYGHEIFYNSPSNSQSHHQQLRPGNYYPPRGSAGLHTIPAGAFYNLGGSRSSGGPGYGSAGLPFSAAGPPASVYNPDIDSSRKSPVPATATAPGTFQLRQPTQAFAQQETLEEGPYYNTGLQSGQLLSNNYPSRNSLELAGGRAPLYSGPDARNSFYPYNGGNLPAGVPIQPSRNSLDLAGKFAPSLAGLNNRFSGVVPTAPGNSFYPRPGPPPALLFTPNTVQQPAETAGQLGEYRKALQEEQRQRLYPTEGDGDIDDEQTQDDFRFSSASSVGGPYDDEGITADEDDSFLSLKNNAENGNVPKSYVNVKVNGDRAYNFRYRT